MGNAVGTRVVSKAAKYGRVPVSLLCSAPSEECHLYAYLTTFDFKWKGEVWPGRERAAHDLGWPVRRVDRALAGLASRKAIARIQAGNGRPARIELLADVVDDTAVQAALSLGAGLPEHVDSLAQKRDRTTLRTREERSASSYQRQVELRDAADEARHACGKCGGLGEVDHPERGSEACVCTRKVAS